MQQDSKIAWVKSPKRSALRCAPVSDTRRRVLIVEDDAGIGANLRRAMTADDIDVDWAQSCGEALSVAVLHPPDVALVDIGLPDGDGIDLCGRLLARQPALPIIILTARTNEIDVVVGLDSGAVDYVTKPFRLAELLARVRAHLRRAARATDEIRIGELTIEPRARRVAVAGEPVELRAKEYDLLVRLADDAGAVVRRETLMDEVWDEHWSGSTKTLDVTIASLRRKLNEVVSGAVAIATVRGVGYRLEKQ